MQSFIRRPTRRAAIAAGAAGLAVIGAVGVGAAAFADGTTPTPGTSHSAMAAPSGAPSDAPAGAPAGGPGRTHAPHIGGTVRSIDGSTVTVQDPEGFTRTVALAGDVTVTKDGASASSSGVTVGTWIEATGKVDANGTTLDATAVSIGRPTPPKGAPAGPAGGRPAPPAGRGSAPTPPSPPSSASAPSGS